MIRFAKIIRSAVLNGLALGLLALPARAAQPVAVPASLPLYFEASQGQAGGPAQFVARGHDYQFLVSAAGAQIALRKTDAESAAVRMQLVGANPQAQICGDAELPGKVNYLTGNDPAQWRRGVGMFAKVRVGELYPGINLVYYGNQRQLEYDFTIAPGASPDVIAFHFDGTEKISINPQGEMILSLAGGEIRQAKPVIYQTIGGQRKEIAGGYRLVDAHTVAFGVGQYDHGQLLIIDPVLEFSTYFGGTAGDTAWAVALDTNGFIYVAGETFSPKFYTNGWPLGPAFSTYGAFQTNYNGGKYAGDAFVTKLDITATSATVYYLTYLGGNGDNAAYSIAVDNAGNAYVAGYTDATNFPTTNAIPGHTNISGVFDPNVKLYPSDAFVAELDASGSNLVYSTYLGGSGADAAYGVAVDTSGHAFVTGFTYSTNFPTTTNARFRQLQCTNSFYYNANAFVTEIASNGGSLVYSTYFGGTNYDVGKGIAVDTNGFVYVTGFTASTNFPTTNYVQQLIGGRMVDGHLLNGSTNKNIAFDAFVAKFDSIGTNLVLVYSTLLGSTNNDEANGIAVDNNGAAYVTGWTISTNFPNTVTNIAALHSFVATNTTLSVLATNVFLTKITNGIGTSAGIAWSAVFGGKGRDVGNGVAVDPAGNDVFVTGSASSTNFPIYNVPGLMSRTNSGKSGSGKSDVFVIAFTSDASALLYSGYLGGKENDFGYGIAVDASGDAYVVGQTLSTNFPTFNAPQTFRNGTNDAFLTKIILTPGPPAITSQPGDQTVEVGSSVTFSVYGNVTGPEPYFYQWQKDGTNLVNGTNLLSGASVITSGSTNDTLILSNVQTNNNGFYYVVVTNYGGAVTSVWALLTVTNIPPTVAAQPASQTNGVGTTVTLTAIATGSAPLSYQWQLNGTNLVNKTNQVNGVRAITSGATSNVLTISNVQLTNAGTYTVIVTNKIYGGSAATNASLSVQATPFLLLQPTPTNQSLAAGATAALAVTAVGAVPLHYQWKLNGTKVANVNDHIFGATTNLLIIGNAQTTNSGNYTVVITNVDGSVTSSVATVTVTNVPPGITQPISQTNGVGTTVIFAVTATNGTPPLHYQWQLFGTNLAKLSGRITGVTSNMLTLSKVQLTNSGDYTVVVTNIAGAVTSSVATLTVVASPEITVQPTPTNQSLAVGSTATLTVTALGTMPLHYQWKLNGTNVANVNGHIIGATTNVLVISNAQTTNSGDYTVVVTNIAGSVTSSNAYVTVTNILPSITSQPTSQTVVVGANVTNTVIATGTAPLHYQWQMNGTNLVNGTNTLNGQKVITRGATTNILTLLNAQTNNSGDYTVIVTNFGGSVTSSVAAVIVASSPVIITQPTNQSAGVGLAATFTVTAVGITPLHYQWQVGGVNLTDGTSGDGSQVSGSTTTNLTISNLQTNENGNSYSVVVTNAFELVTSSNALLTVTNVAPAIVVQPQNQTLRTGSNATFTVTASGTAPLSYQWQLNGTNLLDGTNVDGSQISGSITTNLTVSFAQTNEDGNYTVIITNVAGSVISSTAVLTVAQLAMTNQPSSQKVGVGADASFSVGVSGTQPLSYQWFQNGTNILVNGGRINGANTNQLTIRNVQTNDSGSQFSVTVTNLAGSVSSTNVTLTVTLAPVITMQPTPADQVLSVGSTATFTVTASGAAPLSYQWQLNGTSLVDGANLVDGDIISGSTTYTLTISNVQTNDSGANYTVIVTNAFGSVTSSNAALTVIQLMVVAWGDNTYGQTNVSVASTNAMAIAGGGFHSLVLQTNGTVVAWGAGQINNPSDGIDFGQAIVPAGLSNVVAIAGGGYHSLALTANGTAVAWGAGQTNNPSDEVDFGQAIVPAGLSNVVAIAGGFFHSLALTANGTVVAWGAGQTNNPSDGIDFGQAIVPAGLSNVVAIAGGGYHSLALTANGTVVAWGAGQINNPGDGIDFGQAIVPAGLSNVVAIAGGGYHSLVLTTNGTVVAWGDDSSGQTNVPAGLTNVVAIATGFQHSLALENDGSPYIVMQPASQTVLTNTTVTFTVTALGAPTLVYQWQKDGTNLVDGGNVSGSATATLTLTDVQAADAAGYTVVITNAIGSVTSSNAVLTVTDIPPSFISPSFGNIIAGSGVSGSFILSGTGGLSDGTYYVLISSNLLTPLTDWTYIATNQFDSEGNFIFTNIAPTNAPQEFYLLQLP
ncbi:MAG: immunoglobulin domain-containing protein [Limisphaerales bacterium]